MSLKLALCIIPDSLAILVSFLVPSTANGVTVRSTEYCIACAIQTHHPPQKTIINQNNIGLPVSDPYIIHTDIIILSLWQPPRRMDVDVARIGQVQVTDRHG